MGGGNTSSGWWVAATLEPSPAASAGVHQQEATPEAEPELKPGTLIWDPSVPSGILSTVLNNRFWGIFNYLARFSAYTGYRG